MNAIYVYSGKIFCQFEGKDTQKYLEADDAIITGDKIIKVIEDSEFFELQVSPFVKHY